MTNAVVSDDAHYGEQKPHDEREQQQIEKMLNVAQDRPAIERHNVLQKYLNPLRLPRDATSRNKSGR